MLDEAIRWLAAIFLSIPATTGFIVMIDEVSQLGSRNHNDRVWINTARQSQPMTTVHKMLTRNHHEKTETLPTSSNKNSLKSEKLPTSSGSSQEIAMKPTPLSNSQEKTETLPTSSSDNRLKSEKLIATSDDHQEKTETLPTSSSDNRVKATKPLVSGSNSRRKHKEAETVLPQENANLTGTPTKQGDSQTPLPIKSKQNTPSMAQPLKRVDPIYPPRAERLGLEGWVSVRFNISPLGEVFNATVMRSKPPNVFDTAVLNAITLWEYTPTEFNQPSTKDFIINFKLDN